MKTQLLFICYLLPVFVFAQSFQWIKDGGSAQNLASHDYEQVHSIATDSQKNVYVLSKVGMSNLNIDGNPKDNYDNPSSFPTDVVLASFTCDGTYRWSKIIGGGNTEEISAVQVDSQDNVYIAGKMMTCNDGSAFQPYPGRIEDDYLFTNATGSCNLIFLAKFDTNGVFQYIKRPQLPTTSSNAITYTGSFNLQIHDDILYWFVWLPPGIYADGAFTNSISNPTTPFVLKYNMDGTFIEATQLGTIEGTFSMVVKYYRNPYNGHCYMTFAKLSPTNFSINGQPIDNAAALVCYDQNGNLLWKRENDNNNPNNMAFFDLDFDSQNNIYVAGSMTGNHLNSFLGYSIAILNTPAFVMKLDANAENLLWASHHLGIGNSGYGALVYNGSEIAFTGWCGSTNFTWGTQSIYVTAPNQGQDVLLARFDSTSGACLSLHNIPSTVGSTDRGTAIAVDASGDYLIGGGFAAQIFDTYGNVVYNEGGDTDFFIAKFASEPCTPLSQESFETNSIKVYPNPAKHTLTVEVYESVNYELYTITGQLVKQGKLTILDNTIALQELPKGYYLLRIGDEKGNRHSVKVMKE